MTARWDLSPTSLVCIELYNDPGHLLVLLACGEPGWRNLVVYVALKRYRFGYDTSTRIQGPKIHRNRTCGHLFVEPAMLFGPSCVYRSDYQQNAPSVLALHKVLKVMPEHLAKAC